MAVHRIMEPRAQPGALPGLSRGWSLTATYITERQNPDGGYSFAQGAESSAADTYYALASLRLLGVSPARPGDTARFLQRLQRSDGSFDSIAVAFFVTAGLQHLNAAPGYDVLPYLISLQGENGIFGGLQADCETSSELEQTHLALEVLQLVGHKPPLERTCHTVLGLQNPDGSFGRGGYSTLAGTWHALAILTAGQRAGLALPAALRYVRQCEDPSGGFRRSPDSRDGYRVVDDTYFGCRCLALAHAQPRYPAATLKAIAQLRNANGGFRRSPFLGIATFEATYYAVAASHWLGAGCPAQ